MSDTYSITIALDNYTLTKLNQSGQSLRAYKGVKGSVSDAFCTVWFTTTKFLQTMNIQWEEQYDAYIASTESKFGNIINANNNQPINLGQLMTVQDDGVAIVTINGTAGEIDIKNAGFSEWTCGIGQTIQGNLSPLCALTLYGNDFRGIAPLEKILLNFDYGALQIGEIVEKAWIKSILIDFSLTRETQVSVSYNIDSGWDAQGAVWAQTYTDTVEIAYILNESLSRF